jgi:hypothetical protein
MYDGTYGSMAMTATTTIKKWQIIANVRTMWAATTTIIALLGYVLNAQFGGEMAQGKPKKMIRHNASSGQINRSDR